MCVCVCVCVRACVRACDVGDGLVCSSAMKMPIESLETLTAILEPGHLSAFKIFLFGFKNVILNIFPPLSGIFMVKNS